ncbi:hypothetical protein J2785_003492 [Burkholderia ambifaria]|nr:ACP synthase [Burkholderia ambifaria]MDR6500336.1 hypothetical protein [Burkholderia ambifaria]
MKRVTPYVPPTTYAAIVADTIRRHEQRITELQRAAKHIIAVERDLTKLAESKIFVDTDRYSMYLVDYRKAGSNEGRRQWALRILPSYSIGNAADRVVDGFLSLGWIVERVDPDGSFTKVILRRPKTLIRLALDCSLAFANNLQSQEAVQ